MSQNLPAPTKSFLTGLRETAGAWYSAWLVIWFGWLAAADKKVSKWLGQPELSPEAKALRWEDTMAMVKIIIGCTVLFVIQLVAMRLLF